MIMYEDYNVRVHNVGYNAWLVQCRQFWWSVWFVESVHKTKESAQKYMDELTGKKK